VTDDQDEMVKQLGETSVDARPGDHHPDLDDTLPDLPRQLRLRVREGIPGLGSPYGRRAVRHQPRRQPAVHAHLFGVPGKAKPERFGTTPKSVFVWDGKYSNGYRNHAFFVTTPDGKTTLLRPKVIADWDKNAPHPVAITAKGSYHLPNWVEGETLKSLKSLGLDTTIPGTYTITGLYEETGNKAENEGGKAREATQMWGGSIISNTITVEVMK